MIQRIPWPTTTLRSLLQAGEFRDLRLKGFVCCSLCVLLVVVLRSVAVAAVADTVVERFDCRLHIPEVSRRPWHSSHASSSRCLAAQRLSISKPEARAFCAPPPGQEPRVLRRRHLDHQAQVRRLLPPGSALQVAMSKSDWREGVSWAFESRACGA